MISNIRNSLKRIEGHAIKTPLHLSERLSEKYDCEVYLKREDLQKTRSFKIRGSLNKILKNHNSMGSKEIVCASAGNHAQGVAYSCNLLGIKGKIFCPTTTPPQKLNRILHFGGNNIHLDRVGNNFNESLEIAQKYSNDTGGIFVHPYDDIDVIEGQATIGLEIYRDLPDVNTIIGCLGGGGLMSGVGSFFQDKKINIYAVEPFGAESMTLAYQSGGPIKMEKIDNFVDGASVSRVGDLTYKICREVLDDIFVVDNGRICSEMLELYQEDGIIVEPAGCLGVCGLDKLNNIEGEKIVCIVSGGNNDITRYQEILEKNAVYLGIRHYYWVEFTQKPMELKRFLEEVIGEDDDITRFEYCKRTNKTFGKVLVGFETLENKKIEEKMRINGFQFRKIGNDDLFNFF
jgi:threonine dehydratase